MRTEIFYKANDYVYATCRYLHKSTLGVADVAIELSITDTVHLSRDPADMAIQVVLFNKVKHLFELSLLLLVL
jgi:hypothetical protein